MTNLFEVRGDVTAIKLNRRIGDGPTETLIDTEDLERVHNASIGLYILPTYLGYVQICLRKSVLGRRYATTPHRFVMGEPRGLEVDHVNHDTFDNRKANLRTATHAQNHQNRAGAGPASQTHVRGVRARGSGFATRVRVNGREIYVGTYPTLEEAAEAVSAARARLMPFSLDASRGPALATPSAGRK